jgi:hypothetical protein
MPVRLAAELGLLGHDAVVMRQRQHHLRPQQLLQTAENLRPPDPVDKRRMAAMCLF